MSQTDALIDRLDIPAEVQTELLSSRRRCRLLVTLAEMGDAAVIDLATQVRAGERGVAPAAVAEAETEQIRQELFDRHIPKLTATGIVEYDSLLGKLRLAEPAILPAARQHLSEPDTG